MEFLFLTRSDERVPFVLMIKNGAAFDPIEKWGITYLTTLMIFEQHDDLREVQIQQGLRERDADLNFGVEGDAIYFFGGTPKEHLVDTLNLLAEMVVRPVFNEEDFQQTRQRVILEIELEQQHLGMVSQDLFLDELFQANPYAHSVKGTTESLNNLSLSDVRTQYRKLFMPNQAQLAVYHSGDRNEIFRALSRHWGSWIRHNPLSFTFRQARPLPTQQLKLLLWIQPIMMTFIFFNFASGLNLYYATSNLATIPQQYLIAKERRQLREQTPVHQPATSGD